MIDLYSTGPKPLSAESLARRAAELIRSPQLLPKEMEGFGLGLTPL
jgi:hypothetical protein